MHEMFGRRVVRVIADEQFIEINVQASSDWRFTADATGTAVMLLQEVGGNLDGSNGVMGRSVVLTSAGGGSYCAAITRSSPNASTFRSDRIDHQGWPNRQYIQNVL